MGKCKYCGKEIGFSLTGFCRECFTKHVAETKATIKEHEYFHEEVIS